MNMYFFVSCLMLGAVQVSHDQPMVRGVNQMITVDQTGGRGQHLFIQSHLRGGSWKNVKYRFVF